MKKFPRAAISLTIASMFSLALLPAPNQASAATLADTTAVADTATPAVAADGLTTAQFKAIAEDGFIYGLPLVMNYAIMNEYAVDPNSSQFKAPFNHIKNEARVFTYKDTAVVTANSDTPYSLGWLDLRAEPIVITIPTVKNRYYSVMLNDGHTYNYGYMGSRATGGKAGSFMVVGPDWKGEKPAGIDEVFHSLTPFSLLAFRTQLMDPADMPNVEKIQAQYKVQPLSAFLGQPAPAAAPDPHFLPATTAGIKANFWTYLGAALQYVPEADEDKDIRAKLAQIGVGPGKTFDMKSLSPERQQAMVEAMKAGDAKVDTYLASGLTDVNGWQLGSLPGDRAHYNGDWLMRAGAAKAGIYGNDAVEAVYLFGRVDTNGQTIDTSKHNYTFTFAKGELPPVNAFWSVTMYYGKSQLMVKNPIDRYLVNTAMVSDMKKNADGSVTIYIQKDSPGKAKQANWLPAPNEAAYMVMRLYWPKPATDAVSVLPVGKGTWQPPGIVVAGESASADAQGTVETSESEARQVQITPLTDENYSLAETDGVFASYVKKIAAETDTNGVGVFWNDRKGADPKERAIMRINFDTLYSWAICDLTDPVTVTLPENNGRYQSVWVVSEDGYYPGAFTTPGEHVVTKEWVGGARYAAIVVRTQVNTRDPSDLAKAHALQDQLKLSQKDRGVWAPEHHWDKKAVLAMRAKYMKIGTEMSTADMFGKKGHISLRDRNAGNAFGWGGFTPDQAVYPQYYPTSDAPQTLTLKDVPVKAFWSITVYDKKGYPQTDTYNINSSFAAANEDGSYTIHFGGDKNAKNYMETFPGWNFTLRMYEPTEAYFNGQWVKPKLELVK